MTHHVGNYWISLICSSWSRENGNENVHVQRVRETEKDPTG